MTPHFAPKMHLPMSVSLLPLQGPFDNRDSLNLPQVTGCEGTGSQDILGTFILDGGGCRGSWKSVWDPGALLAAWLSYGPEAAEAARFQAGMLPQSLLSNSLVPASFWLSSHSSSSND